MQIKHLKLITQNPESINSDDNQSIMLGEYTTTNTDINIQEP